MQFALFDTSVGRCGIIWSPRGIAGVQLPERDENATRVRLTKRHPGAREADPPHQIRETIEAIAALLRGEPRDMSSTSLDMSDVPPLHRQVYAIARAIPPGATLSYGEIAEQLGDKSMARDVGAALGANPFPIVVPCHRVLAAGGKVGGFSAHGGVTTKLRLLEIEGAQVGEAPTLFGSLPLTPPRRRRQRY